MSVCPIRLQTRSVLIRTQAAVGTPETGLGQSDYINVTSVSVSHEATEIARSDVYGPSGAGMPALQAGHMFVMQIVQELYPTPVKGSSTGWQHLALFKAGPFKVVNGGVGDDDITVEQAAGTCWGVDVMPATVEVVEVGGNTYRMYDAVVENLEIAGTPNQRIMLTWTLRGKYVAPADSTKGPFTPASIMPILYRESGLSWSGTTLATTCPAFTIGLGLTAEQIESACVGGGNISIADFSEPVSLNFSGALAVKESVLGVWDDMISRQLGAVSFLIDTPSDPMFGLSFINGQLTNIALSEVARYVGYDLTWQNAGVWSLSIGGVNVPTP